jgi:hypothetical protein
MVVSQQSQSESTDHWTTNRYGSNGTWSSDYLG